MTPYTFTLAALTLALVAAIPACLWLSAVAGWGAM